MRMGQLAVAGMAALLLTVSAGAETVAGGAGAGAPVAAQAAPAPAVQAAIRASVKALLRDGAHAKIEEIRPTPLKGLFEVRVARHLLYVDEKGEFAFLDANLLDLKAQRNLTQERRDELMRVDFRRDLPLDKAIKQVYGNGKRVLAIFEDPNCSYCRRMRSTLAGLDNLTLYTFPYPILSESSRSKSEKAWCAKDRSAAWGEMMMKGTVPDNDGSCATPLDEFIALGRRLNVNGTPTLFFPDGRRVPGAVPAGRIERLLAEQAS